MISRIVIKSSVSNYLGFQWFRIKLKPYPGEQCLEKEEALGMSHVISGGMKRHSRYWFTKQCAHWAFLLSLFHQLGFTVLISGFRPPVMLQHLVCLLRKHLYIYMERVLQFFPEIWVLWNLPHDFASPFTLNKLLILLWNRNILIIVNVWKWTTATIFFFPVFWLPFFLLYFYFKNTDNVHFDLTVR